MILNYPGNRREDNGSHLPLMQTQVYLNVSLKSPPNDNKIIEKATGAHTAC